MVTQVRVLLGAGALAIVAACAPRTASVASAPAVAPAPAAAPASAAAVEPGATRR